MGNLSRFMKKNKIVKENTKFVATESLMDEKGSALEWEIKPLTSKEIQDIREDCTIDIVINAKKGQYRQKIDTRKLGAKLIAASVVYPNLFDSELQDSYEVKTPEDLVFAMIDDPGEFNHFTAFMQEFNGLNKDFNDKVEEVKN